MNPMSIARRPPLAPTMNLPYPGAFCRHPLVRRLALSLAVIVPVATLRSQTTASEPDANSPVVLSPFEVTSAHDHGYRSSNSVSATRVNTPVRDLPITIDTFTEEFIHDLQPRDLLDIVQFAPGVSSASGDFAGGNNGNFNIRGFASGNPLRNGFKGPNVVDPITIARVEVVRGPSSLLYGQLPPGGLVNYITKRPLDKPSTTVTQRFGSYDYYRTELDTTGPIGGGSNLFYRFNGAYENGQQYYDPSESKTKVFAPVLQWRNATSSLTLDYQYFHRDEDPEVFMSPFFVTPGFQYLEKVPNLPKNFSALGNADHRTSDTRAFVADWQVKVADWDFRADYSLARQEIAHYLTATLFIFDSQRSHPFLNRTASLQNVASTDQTGQFEALHDFKFNGGSWKLLLGYQVNRRNEYFNMRAIPGALAPPAWDLLNPSTWDRNVRFDINQLSVINDPAVVITDNEGFYAVNQVNLFNDKLGLLGGARYSKVKSTTINQKTNTVTGVSISQKETSPQVGVTFKLTPEISAYGSYSESFVPTGGAKVVNGAIVGPFDPTVGKGFDLGFKADFMDGRLSSTLAYFQLENTGIVNNVVTGTDPITNLPVFTTFQSGVQASKGVEFSGVYAVNESWQVLYSYSYLDAYVKTNLANRAQEGFQLSNTAHQYFDLWTKYSFQHGGMKGAYLAGGINYMGKRLVDLSNQNLFWDPLYLVTLSAGYVFNVSKTPLSVDLTCKNAADKVYFPTNNSRGSPRTLILSVSAKF
ncbi:MAG: TonB-dependent receptor plug [Verrucomicrobia bacterium]|nr:TonB-dependent receptor plug [Verrucomicrobiota bacterium]